MKRILIPIWSIAFASVVQALTLPVADVATVADRQEKVFPGRVVAPAYVEITPEVSGEIVEVCFENGAIVKEGQVLYRLNPIKYRANLKNAKAKVAECRAKKLYAENAYARHEKLVQTKAVSQDAMESARADRDVASASLEAAEAELAVAEYNLAHCEVKAPITGKIGTTRLTRGNYAGPEKGALATLVQIQPIRVRFALSSGDFLSLAGGRTRTLKEKGDVAVLLANGTTFAESGSIEYSENVADEATDTIRLYATFPNAERLLRPGETVGVRLANHDGVAKPAVPPTAVMQDMRGAYVWALDAEGRAERRRIVRGRLADDAQIVEEGLKVGERVVADGVHKVEAGAVVTPAK